MFARPQKFPHCFIATKIFPFSYMLYLSQNLTTPPPFQVATFSHFAKRCIETQKQFVVNHLNRNVTKFGGGKV